MSSLRSVLGSSLGSTLLDAEVDAAEVPAGVLDVFAEAVVGKETAVAMKMAAAANTTRVSRDNG